MDAAVRVHAAWAEEELEARSLREAQGTRKDFIRRMAEAIRWLSQEQPADAIGNVFGMRTRDVYPLSNLTRDLYHLRAVPHTSTGKPALQLVMLDSWVGDRRHHAREIPEPDQKIFWQLADGITHGRVIADWCGVNGGSFYSIALNIRVHPSLIRAVTYNASALACTRERLMSGCPKDCTPCPYRMERMGRFVVPEFWT